MIINAVGVWDASPKGMSDLLQSLNVSHTVFYESSRSSLIGHSTLRSRYNIVDVELGYEQPAWPIVLNGLRSYSLAKSLYTDYPRLVLVCDSKSALKTTNLDLLDVKYSGKVTKTQVKQFLRLSTSISGSKDSPFELTYFPEDIQALVESASKPSVLADIQTLIYKIHPYADQKIVRITTILYLIGTVSQSKMRRILRRNLKSIPIIELLEGKECSDLKSAVELYRSGRPLDEVTSNFGIESFDITYIVSSASKMSIRDLPS